MKLGLRKAVSILAASSAWQELEVERGFGICINLPKSSGLGGKELTGFPKWGRGFRGPRVVDHRGIEAQL